MINHHHPPQAKIHRNNFYLEFSYSDVALVYFELYLPQRDRISRTKKPPKNKYVYCKE